MTPSFPTRRFSASPVTRLLPLFALTASGILPATAPSPAKTSASPGLLAARAVRDADVCCPPATADKSRTGGASRRT